MISQWVRWSDWMLFLVPVTGGNVLVRERDYINYLLRVIREAKEIPIGKPIPAFFVVLRDPIQGL